MSHFMEFFKKNKPGIAIGLGLSSMFMATLTGIRYAPEARDALEAKKEELGVDKLSAVDTVKTVGLYFLPPIIFTGTGIFLILKGNQMNLDRGAAAMAAYAISESTLREYREKTREIVGEKKEKDIREAVGKDIMTHNPAVPGTIIVTGKGDCLCFDNIARQHFMSSKTKIESIINQINYDMLHGCDTITLNEYCLRMGLEEVELGQELGWDVNSNGLISVSFTSSLTEDGTLFLVIEHNTIPKALNI